MAVTEHREAAELSIWGRQCRIAYIADLDIFRQLGRGDFFYQRPEWPKEYLSLGDDALPGCRGLVAYSPVDAVNEVGISFAVRSEDGVSNWNQLVNSLSHCSARMHSRKYMDKMGYVDLNKEEKNVVAASRVNSQGRLFFYTQPRDLANQIYVIAHYYRISVMCVNDLLALNNFRLSPVPGFRVLNVDVTMYSRRHVYAVDVMSFFAASSYTFPGSKKDTGALVVLMDKKAYVKMGLRNLDRGLFCGWVKKKGMETYGGNGHFKRMIRDLLGYDESYDPSGHMFNQLMSPHNFGNFNGYMDEITENTRSGERLSWISEVNGTASRRFHRRADYFISAWVYVIACGVYGTRINIYRFLRLAEMLAGFTQNDRIDGLPLGSDVGLGHGLIWNQKMWKECCSFGIDGKLII